MIYIATCAALLTISQAIATSSAASEAANSPNITEVASPTGDAKKTDAPAATGVVSDGLPPTKSETERLPAPILPTLQLDGKTEGEASFTVGATIRFGIDSSGETDLEFSPRLKVSTADGLARLISTSDHDDETQSAAWKVGLAGTLHFIASSDDWYKEPEAVALSDQVNKAAFDACVKACPENDKGANCAAFNEARADGSRAIDSAELCQEGRLSRQPYEDYTILKFSGAHPALSWSFGFQMGRQEFKYFSPSTTAGSIEKNTEGFTDMEGGVSVASVFKSAGRSLKFSFEAFFGGGSDTTPSTKKAEACQILGDLPPDAALPDPTGSQLQTRYCLERPFGLPTTSGKLVGGLYLGIIPKLSDSWRVAVGARVNGRFEEDDRPVQLYVELPLYVNFGNISEYTGTYKGLLKVVPQVRLDLGGNSPEPAAFIVQLELSTQRTLFGDALDRL